MIGSIDRYDVDRTHRGLLQQLNPVTKLLAIIPVLVILALVTDPYTPLLFSIAASLVTIVFGRISPLRYLRLTVPLWGLTVGFVIVYPLVMSDMAVDSSPVLFAIGPLTVYEAGLRLGIATALRVLSLAVLSMLFVLTTDIESFLRAVMQHLRLPYRIGYAAMAAFRFAPLLRSDFETIRAAQTIRATPGRRGVRGRVTRLYRCIVPVLVNAIRRAERTALAMDARAFGVSAERTYYRRSSFEVRDLGFVVGFWLLAGGILWAVWRAGVFGTLTIFQ